MITEKTPLELQLANLLVENTSCCGEEADKVIPMIFSLLNSNKHEPQVMPKIAEIYHAMAYLFSGGEFPNWLNEQEIPFAALREYEEARKFFMENILINIDFMQKTLEEIEKIIQEQEKIMQETEKVSKHWHRPIAWHEAASIIAEMVFLKHKIISNFSA